VSLVTGIHPTTVKIFVYKDCVADITFAYESLFKDMKKSALTYDGMLFRNPIIQYVDQHRALTYPYENEPTETINNRWVKDFERFCLLYSVSPVLSQQYNDANQQAIQVKLANNYVYAGLYAVRFYLEKYGVKVANRQDNVYLMNDKDRNAFMIKYGNQIKSQKRYKAFGELLPSRTEMMINDVKYTILHCRNKTSIYYMEHQNEIKEKVVNNARLNIASVIAKEKNEEVGKSAIVSVNFCIMYCFSMFRITGDEIYNTYYGMLLDLVYNAYKNGNTDLYPSIITYGDELENPIVAYMNEHPELRMQQVHVSSDNTDEQNADEIAKLPWDYEYEESVYVLDGSEIKK
jgi:hypothetical protein